MTLTVVLDLIALLLWCHALVLVVAWLRAVRADDLTTHVGHAVNLVGVFVPVACSLVLLLGVGWLLGLPSMVAVLHVLVPGCIGFGLHLETSRLQPPVPRAIAMRLGLTLAMVACVVLWRGGL